MCVCVFIFKCYFCLKQKRKQSILVFVFIHSHSLPRQSVEDHFTIITYLMFYIYLSFTIFSHSIRGQFSSYLICNIFISMRGTFAKIVCNFRTCLFKILILLLIKNKNMRMWLLLFILLTRGRRSYWLLKNININYKPNLIYKN